MEQPITALQTPDCDWLLHSFIEVNFSKLTDCNQIFRKDFIGIHYHLCKIWSQIIEGIIFAPYVLSITTIYNDCLLYDLTQIDSVAIIHVCDVWRTVQSLQDQIRKTTAYRILQYYLLSFVIYILYAKVKIYQLFHVDVHRAVTNCKIGSWVIDSVTW